MRPTPRRDRQAKCMPFPADARRFLGKWSDAKIHRRFRISLPIIRLERELKNIPATRIKRRIIWSAAMLRQLPNLSDAAFGERYGISPTSAGIKRIALGALRTFRSISEQKLIAIKRDLARLSNSVVGRKHGFSPNVAGALRKRFNLPVLFDYDKQINWTRKMLGELGTISDYNYSERYGISRVSIVRKRKLLGIHPYNASSNPIHWTPTMLRVLGTISDDKFSKRFGIGYATVVTKRHNLRIKSVRGRVPTKRSGPFRRRLWTNTMVGELGMAPDPEIARKFGLTRVAVHHKRVRMRIPAFKS